MDDISKRLEVYIKSRKFDGGTSECETVLDQIYQAYAESHESDHWRSVTGSKNWKSFWKHFP